LKDYDPHYLLLAINAVKSGKMTAVVASKFYGVPRTTIITRIARGFFPNKICYNIIITLLLFFIEMLQYDWL
jgi:hypothetical protein